MGQLDASRQAGCPLCQDDGGDLVARSERLRVIRVIDADYPGFYRVIWNDHVAELTDLQPSERRELMDAVATVEGLMRAHLQPTKVNLASLGNMVPHLHWHLIARYPDDRHFPQPIWGETQRDGAAGAEHVTDEKLRRLDQEIAAAFPLPA